jgi:hypothetical protein
MTATGWTSEVPDTSGMTEPVRCTHDNCGKTYDLATVPKIREGASSYWTAPCCGTPVDDRGETASAWKSMEHYVRLGNRS